MFCVRQYGSQGRTRKYVFYRFAETFQRRGEYGNPVHYGPERDPFLSCRPGNEVPEDGFLSDGDDRVPFVRVRPHNRRVRYFFQRFSRRIGIFDSDHDRFFGASCGMDYRQARSGPRQEETAKIAPEKFVVFLGGIVVQVELRGRFQITGIVGKVRVPVRNAQICVLDGIRRDISVESDILYFLSGQYRGQRRRRISRTEQAFSPQGSAVGPYFEGGPGSQFPDDTGVDAQVFDGVIGYLRKTERDRRFFTGQEDRIRLDEGWVGFQGNASGLL